MELVNRSCLGESRNTYHWICKTELANSPKWPIRMYRTTELANFSELANSYSNWPIRRILLILIKSVCLIQIKYSFLQSHLLLYIN